MAQHVYLLQEQDFSGTPTGLYKIGKTTQDSIDARARQYRAGNARPVKEYHSVIVHDCQASETALHREYKQFRLKAGGGDEWFQLQGRSLAGVVASMDACAIGRRRQAQSAPVAVFRETPRPGGIPAILWWVIAGAGALFLLSARAGTADIVVGQQYKINQHPYRGCPAARQPCNGSNVWSDDYRVIATIKNGEIVTVSGRPQDPKYTEVVFPSGLRGWVYTESLTRPR